MSVRTQANSNRPIVTYLLPNLHALSLGAPGGTSAGDREESTVLAVVVPSPLNKNHQPRSFRAALERAKEAKGQTARLKLPLAPAFRHLRNGLSVDISNQVGAGLGLFTHDLIPVGGFIGLFSGIWAWESDVDSIFKASEKAVQSYMSRFDFWISPCDEGLPNRQADRLLVLPRTNSEVSSGGRYNIHYEPSAPVNDVLALMNNAPTAPEGVAPTVGEHANVRLETALLPRRNQTGAVEYYACIAAFALDAIGSRSELLIDYGYSLVNRVKFKPRKRIPFSRLQHMTKSNAYWEARNQGVRVEGAMEKLRMEPPLNDLIGPAIRDVTSERSTRTGAVVLEARLPTLLDPTKGPIEMAAARTELRKRVLGN